MFLMTMLNIAPLPQAYVFRLTQGGFLQYNSSALQIASKLVHLSTSWRDLTILIVTR